MRKRISREDFERLPAVRTSRWTKFMAKLTDGEPRDVPLDKDEQNGDGRMKVRRQIQARANRLNWRIRIRTVGNGLIVQYLGEREEG